MDPKQGKILIAKRMIGVCPLCHSSPFFNLPLLYSLKEKTCACMQMRIFQHLNSLKSSTNFQNPCSAPSRKQSKFRGRCQMIKYNGGHLCPYVSQSVDTLPKFSFEMYSFQGVVRLLCQNLYYSVLYHVLYDLNFP